MSALREWNTPEKQTPVIMIPGNHDQVSLGGAVHSLQVGACVYVRVYVCLEDARLPACLFSNRWFGRDQTLASLLQSPALALSLSVPHHITIALTITMTDVPFYFMTYLYKYTPIYIHIHTYTHMHIYTYTYIHIHIRPYTHTYTPTAVNIRVRPGAGAADIRALHMHGCTMATIPQGWKAACEGPQGGEVY